MLFYFIIPIVLAFVFDFLNGVHDAANSITTLVSTKLITPKSAVLWSAFFNFIAFLIFPPKVATTIGSSLFSVDVIVIEVIIAAFISAIVWNVLTWWLALPVSSSHALIGGLLGAVLMKYGAAYVVFNKLTLIFIMLIISPFASLLFSILFTFILDKFNFSVSGYRKLQLLSSALLSLNHGANDTQKTMGVISMILLYNGYIEHFYVPFWVMCTCSIVIALGTLIGGWSIVKTLGEDVVPLRNATGTSATVSTSFVLSLANYFGMPASTTHIFTGAIAGVAMYEGKNIIFIPVLQKIAIAWFITFPFTCLLSYSMLYVVSLF